MKRVILLILSLLITVTHYSQTSTSKKSDWHLLDYKEQGTMGISLTEAYKLLNGKKNSPVIVAVIDSGVDTMQNDLKENFWHNPGEIPGNGIDDEENGLIDDVIGWNFLGGKNNENLSVSVPEYYRTYYRFKNEFENKQENEVNKERAYVFNQWKKSKAIIDEKYNIAIKEIDILKANYEIITTTSSFLTRFLKKETFTREDLDIKKKNDSLTMSVNLWVKIFGDKEFNNVQFITDYGNYKKKQEEAITQKTTPPIPYRDNLVGDNSNDLIKTNYGNNNLQLHSGYHGTSVSSVIGAVRNNGLGIDGIADNVKIMVLRCALGNDEFDKDIALAIRYAVDHGAKVINMSFGKNVSPDKQWIDDAVKYAQEKDVVLVHAAGNDGKNIDTDSFFPNAYYLDGSRAPNFINVAASGDYSNGGLVAPFTNYGKRMVDIFAPGVEIHCAIANNGTQEASGTSMASPVVAGIAALLRSYFPDLTADKVVEIIKKSGKEITEQVILPGTEDKKVPFNTLSETGRIVNAYNAIKMATEASKK